MSDKYVGELKDEWSFWLGGYKYHHKEYQEYG